jgi:hypothetical protein
MEKSSCTLTVKSGGNTGLLFINKGELVSAEAGELRNYPAALQILGWDNATISIENSCDRTENEINQPLMTILMEGLKRKDEVQASQPEELGLNLELVDPNLGQSEAPAGPPEPVEAGIPVDQVDPNLPQPPPLPGMEKPEAEAPPAAPGEPGVAAIPIQPPTGGITPPMGAGAKKKPAGLPKLAIIGGGVVALLIVVAAVFMFLGGDNSVEDYQVLLDRIAAIGDTQEKVLLLEEFIATHKNAEVLDLARQEIQQVKLKAGKQAYDEAMARLKALPIDDNYATAAAEILEGYLQQYPDGQYSQQIRQAMAEIPAKMEEGEFQRIMTMGGQAKAKLAAMRSYLAVYPQGRHEAEVHQAMWQLAEPYYAEIQKAVRICDEQRSWDNCIRMCEAFLTDFSDHRLSDEVNQLKFSLEDQRDYSVLKAKVSKKLDDYREDRKLYLAFLKSHPDSAKKAEIEGQIQRIEIELAKMAEYESLVEYVSNTHYDIRERVGRLKAYLKKHPDRRYARKAELMLDELQPEYKSVLEQAANAQAQKDASARQERERRLQQQEAQRKQWETEKLQTQLKQLGKRYRVAANGIFKDSKSGLTWVLLDSFVDKRRCFDYQSAQAYVDQLKTGGYSDWRIPTASELAGLYKQRPFFPGSGAPWYWTSETYVKGYHQLAFIVTPIPETNYQKQSRNLKKCGAVRAVRR